MTQNNLNAEIMRLRAEGLSTRQIAKRVGRSQSSVARTLRRHVEPVPDGAVTAALACYLEPLSLDGAAVVLAEVARVLAGRIDALALADSTAAGAALPRVVDELSRALEKIADVQKGRPSREAVTLLKEIR